MAKWKKELVADIFYDGLTKACDQQLISKHHKRHLMKQLAVFFDMKDLKRPNIHKDAIAAKIKANTTSKVGPVKEIPGPKPGEVTVEDYNGVGSGYLSRKKVA